ncbi:diaminopimelate decarboxylase [Pullulanibacillus pueri]|uniref:Diaminopimelate decarboxylase n=1 Tax=Pullulanibacillus pueri TaxID=1437324 RepID=A0A8J2ZV85_9BACL|nr:diaminopimelate decarboxylase [Pullulanibacillus pueri]MBM7681515.1 diaminopimelate decarboxylase [Pullulanibacillus pueri]GGH79188.1 diaminopimelate decarboxylase [Pullulanibacillus pueri]
MRGTQTINHKNHLEIGGVDTVTLAEKYGTPLYVYDVETIRAKSRAFKAAFDHYPINYKVAYASKAFSSVAMVQLAAELDLALDVVSGGELYTALVAGYPSENIHFHGNNKSEQEIKMSIEHHIGAIVVDNFSELEMVKNISEMEQKQVKVLLRMTPGVEAHTHEYITTGQMDSKFGFDLMNGEVKRAIQFALEAKTIELCGLHSHIGSQIFDVNGFIHAIQRVYDHIAIWHKELNYTPDILNVGGGFGIAYTKKDEPQPVETLIRSIVETVIAEAEKHELGLPEIWIEPGRSIVGEAGTTLYTVGTQKNIPNVRKYITVDGGMSDNLRPALYQAEYEAIIANRAGELPEEHVAVAGKLCESGDILIQDIELPVAERGDLLAVFCTGAYGYSMSNNYNRLPRPAVVFVEEGQDQLVIKRETYEDLLQFDLSLQTPIKEK